jgi:light-regulated signal transduction histidine kinase (bacteriophytochrome)
MQQLLNELLSYSRVASRNNPLVPVCSEDALQNAINNLRRIIEESSATVAELDVLPNILGDEIQLTQVFQNLLANAIKCCPGDRSPHVQVSAAEQDDAWLFEVTDDGIGMEPQYLDKIFNMVQRLHSRSEYPGTGVGLAICRKIIVRHGGDIWVESQPGSGSAFYFTLPKATSNVGSVPIQSSSSANLTRASAEPERRAG